MKRFVEGVDRDQSTLFPECLEDWVEEDNAVRVIEAFADGLDLGDLGFSGWCQSNANWSPKRPTSRRSGRQLTPLGQGS